MKQFLTLAACAVFLVGCDFVGGAGETVAFSNLTLNATPLPADEDGSAPDLYVEVQDAGGRAVIKSSIYEDASDATLPLVVSPSGELVGTTRTYYLVVMDRDADGYDLIQRSEPFSADDLRNAADPVFQIADRRGRIQAELTIAR
ncbi:MAG: hypothetical protein R3181_08000 [Rubricoccaceae bacterium]|nr:hypothetical protein [Rubricoccaceae bacterium]